MVDPTIYLISRKKYIFNVLPKYFIITQLVLEEEIFSYYVDLNNVMADFRSLLTFESFRANWEYLMPMVIMSQVLSLGACVPQWTQGPRGMANNQSLKFTPNPTEFILPWREVAMSGFSACLQVGMSVIILGYLVADLGATWPF